MFNYGHANSTRTITMGVTKTALESGVHEVTGAYLFQPNTAGHLHPFFGGGAGLLQFSPGMHAALSPAPQSQNKPGLLYVAGLDYTLDHHFDLRAEFRGLLFATPSFMNETFRSNTMHRMSATTFRVVYRL
jgi:opacity protein-like surface antigen